MKLENRNYKRLFGGLFIFFTFLSIGSAQDVIEEAKEGIKEGGEQALSRFDIDLAQIVYLVLTIIFVAAIYYGSKYLLDRQIKGKTDKGLIRSIVLFVIALVGIIAIILAFGECYGRNSEQYDQQF